MKSRLWLKMIAGALALAALLATPGVPVPGADRLGLSGAALAQENIDIDTFYDELEPYGQWVWHPRFGYVWLPEDVTPDWRPYTVGHWVSTEEYGWYWESNEPFAWAVYHYGRWGYDDDYGWFWVPGDTWAPAWVQWRYDDQYVGWAPIGPQRAGYAYGAPVGYEPPVAESWVFVPPRYMTSRAIPHYAVPIANLGVVFLGATRVYRPQFRGGVVYNYGVPRDYVVRITRRPIHVQKIYKVDTWKGGRYDKNHHGNGIRVYAPGVHKGDGHRGPKKFADHPDQFKPKAKLKHTFKGDPPKGFGRSAKDVKSITKQDPDAFKRKHGGFDRGDNDKNGGKDKGQANRDKFQNGGKDNNDNKGQADRDKFKNFGKDNDKNKDRNNGQADKDRDRDHKNGKEKFGTAPAPTLPPPVVKGGTGGKDDQKGFSAGGANKAKHGNRDDNDKGDNNKKKNKNKTQNFGDGDLRTQTERGTVRRDDGGHKNKDKNQNFGGSNQTKSFDQGGGNNNKNKNRDNGDRDNKNKNFGAGGGGQQDQRNQGGGGGGDNNKNNNKKDKCQKHPEKPECR